MKNNEKTTEYFHAKFPIGIILSCIAVAILGLACIVLCIWRIVNFGAGTTWDIIKYTVLFPVSAFCVFISLSVVFHSNYTLTKTQLIQTFGVFRERFSIHEIKSALLDRETNKLLIYTENHTISILIMPSENERFSRALMNANPDIDYGFTLANKPDEK